MSDNIDERFKLRTWDMINYEPLSQLHVGPIAEVLWSADSSQVIAVTTTRGVLIVDKSLVVSSISLMPYYIGPDEPSSSIALHPDGARLAIGSFHQPVIYIWDIVADQQLQVLQGHTGSVLAMDWHTDGDFLASVSLDGTLRTWDATSGQQIDMIDVGAKLYTVDWNPDGSQLAYGGETPDGQTEILEIIQFSIVNARPDRTFINRASTTIENE